MLSSKEIYNKIEKARIQKGITVGRLSQLAGISHATLSAWKNRSAYPTLEVLDGLAVALDIPLAELLFDVDFQNLPPDEIELLSSWRRLNAEQKKAIIATMKTMH